MNSKEYNREIFERVRDHLLTQGMKSVDGTNACMYRGDCGNSCAIGCLITNDAYSIHLENKLVKSVEVAQALESSGIDVDTVSLDMLDELQSIHDDHLIENWNQLLSDLESQLLNQSIISAK